MGNTFWISSEQISLVKTWKIIFMGSFEMAGNLF